MGAQLTQSRLTVACCASIVAVASCNTPGIDGTSNIFLDPDDPRAVITRIEWVGLKSGTMQLTVGDTLQLESTPLNKDGVPVRTSVRQTVTDTAVLRSVPQGICEGTLATCRYVGGRAGSVVVTAETTGGLTFAGQPITSRLMVVVSAR